MTGLAPKIVDLAPGSIRLQGDPAARADGLLIAFTDRHGGTSLPPYDSLNLAARVGDDAGAVSQNRAIVAAAAGYDPANLRLARQVHGADAREVTADDETVVGDADVLVTSQPAVVLGILTADCTPVVVAGRARVAIAHAGWRGLVAGAVEAALEAVGDVEAAWVGPSIHACCYEVGPEVVEAFTSKGLPVAGADRVDPGRAATFALHRAGVTRVASSTECTSCDDRYFSYRRDGSTGRQGAFVGLLP